MTSTNQPAARGSIVVGVDQSDHSKRALAFALDTARRLGVGCHVVHAWDYPAMALASPYATSAWLTDLGPEEHAWLDHVLADTNPQGVAVTSQVVRGAAGSALVDIAAALDAPFVFVGSVGHGAIVGRLLGSVSQYCVHHATCPVVVVPPADRVVHEGSLEAAANARG